MRGDVIMYWSGRNWPFDYGNLLSVASASFHLPVLSKVRLFVDTEPTNNPHWDRVRDLRNVVIERFDPSRLDPGLFERYSQVTHDANRSEVVCYTSLAEYGGLWLDTDTLTIADLADEPETLVLKDPDGYVQEGVIGLPAKHPLAVRMVSELASLSRQHDDDYAAGMNTWRAVVAESGFTDFGDLKAYFPLHWTQWEQGFLPNAFAGDVGRIRIYHWYGFHAHRYTAQMDKGWLASHPCLFSTLAAPIAERL